MAGFIDSFAGGVGSAVAGSIAGKILPKGPSGSELGKEQRAYLDSAFPELNPWEKAGAPSTGASTATAVQNSQERIGRANNSTTAGAAAAQLKQQSKLVDAQVTTQETTAEKNKAEVDFIKAKTANEQGATSAVGKTFKDAKNFYNEFVGDLQKSPNRGAPPNVNVDMDKLTQGISGTYNKYLSPSAQNKYISEAWEKAKGYFRSKNAPNEQQINHRKSSRLNDLKKQLESATTPQQKEWILKKINQYK